MERISIKPDCVFSPQPMYLIGTKNEDNSPNFCVITWLGFSFDHSPHIMISIGGSKQTKSNIFREGKFSANLISCDMIWLADYLGNTKGSDGIKDKVNYEYSWGNKLEVPVLEQSKWIYECSISKTMELDGSHLFLAKIENIQIDKNFETMNMEMIDLTQLDPAIYAPYNYFKIGEKIGECGEWKKGLNIKE